MGCIDAKCSYLCSSGRVPTRVSNRGGDGRCGRKRVPERKTRKQENDMTGVETWALAVGLAMDCLAVAIASGVIMERVRWRLMLTMAIAFGVFQALNPLIGWLGTNYFRHLIESVDHWIAFILLAIIGLNMVREGLSGEEESIDADVGVRAMLPLAIATSIDALAVGITFAMTEGSIALPALIIGVVTFAISAVGVKAGSYVGQRFGSIAEVFGGIILVLIGLKILLEHTGFL